MAFDGSSTKLLENVFNDSFRPNGDAALDKVIIEDSKRRDYGSAAESGASTSEESTLVSAGGLVMKDRAYKICREFLSGTWKNISSTDMVFKSISGGMSNFLYYCSLPETHTPLSSPSEPSQVLLRMYGQLHDGGTKAESSITESVIFMMLAERKLGPKLYGIFPGGRLEEYIPARALTCQELHDPEISAIIAKKLAGVHTLQVPINKEPSWMFDTMTKWLDFIRNNIEVKSVAEESRSLAERNLSIDFESEMKWLRTYLKKINSPVAFCHNDLQEGNILFPDGSREAAENRLVFIDFEYSSYNFRGFDIANHFCEWVFDYSSSEPPYFTCKLEDYPSREQQLHFIRAYLSTLEQPSTSLSMKQLLIAPENHILEEAKAFTCAVHLLWSLWSISNAVNSKIPFGYWEHGLARMDAYFKWKNTLLKSQ